MLRKGKKYLEKSDEAGDHDNDDEKNRQSKIIDTCR
jgi:hypothetical protein